MTYAETIRQMLLPGTPRETFFLLYSRLVEERVAGAQLQFLAEGVLTVKPPGQKEHTLYLHNLYLMCTGNADEGAATIERFLRTLEESIAGLIPTREQVVPQVKDQRYLDILRDPTVIVREHLAADLWIIYAVDSANSITSVAAEQLEALQISRDELPTLALENLKRILPEIECHGDGPSFLLTAGGDYVSSLLLLDEVWQAIADRVEGDIIAVTPSRDVVLFTGSASRQGVAEIRRSARELEASADHAVSSTLLRRVGNGWKVFE